MYLNHFLDDQTCKKKTQYRNLNLHQFDGKEKHYYELFEVLIASLAKEKDTFLKDLKYLIHEKYNVVYYSHENEAKEIQNTVFNLFSRLYIYLKNKECKVIAPGFDYYVDDGESVTYKCDVIVQNTDESIEGIILNSSKPVYSHKGRKFDTKAINSIELNGLLKEMMNRYPDAEIIASFFHLRNKEDRGDLFPEYEHKKGTNIVSISLNEVIKKFKLETEEIRNHFSLISNEFLMLDRKKDCNGCNYLKICKFEENKLKVKSENIRLVENKQQVASGKNQKAVILNKEQSSVLANLKGKCQVVAVPGAGKTRIIVESIKKLVHEKVKPKEILALTFTNKATSEIKQRLDGIEDVRITNYNTFGYSLVREFFDELGYEYPPRLVTMFESFEIIKGILELFKVPFKYEFLYHRTYGKMWEIYRAINYAISKGMSRNTTMLEFEKPEYISSFTLSNEVLEFLPLIAARYQFQLRSLNLISYDQQIDLVNELFSKNPYVVDSLRSRYKYVFLDEYQDTNEQQHKMIMTFATNNLLMVGDEDQSIFGFRGAEPMNFLSFMKDGKNKFFLSKNYRSGERIINEANELISKNVMRNRKKIEAARSNTGAFYEYTLSSPLDIVTIINDLVETNFKLNDIAIICRKNKHIDTLRDVLQDAGYDVQTNFNRLIEEEHFITFRAYLRIVALKASREDEYVVMKHVYGEKRFPSSGSIITASMIHGSESYERFINDINCFGSSGTSRNRIDFIFELINGIGSKVHEYIMELYENLHLASLFELLNVIEGMVAIDEDITIPVVGDGINLITAHSSKGLEFKAVIVYEVDDFVSTGAEEEEERRLLYVAMTRAEDSLHMVRVENGKKNKEVA